METVSKGQSGAEGAWRQRLHAFLHPEAWQFRYLFSLGVAGWSGHIPVVILTAAIQGLERTDVLVWLAVMIALTLTMMYVCYGGSRADDPIGFGWAHTIFTSAVAVTWGAGAFIAVQLSFEKLLLYTFSIGGTALAAVAAQHGVLRSCYASIWISMPMLAAAYTMRPDGGRAEAAMVILYGMVMSIFALRMHRFLMSNHRLTDTLAARVAEVEAERLRADEANEVKTRFVAHASHDLRQPVHAIGMLTEMLRQQEMPAEARETVARIDLSLNALSQLFRSLLDLSALELGELRPARETFELRALLDQVAAQNRAAAAERDSVITVVGAPTHVASDPALVSNIVQNLISNALKYAPGGPVVVGIKRRGAAVDILVMDRGPGMSAEERRRAFEEFYRAQGRTGSGPSGLGLGLALVARYCSLLGLRHGLWSRPGRGTIIEVAGLATAVPAERVVEAGPPRRHWLDGLVVLLVDDDEETLAATGALMQSWGCRVEAMPAPPDAPRACDALVTDFDFGDGLTARPMIEACLAFNGPDLPVIILSGSDAPQIGAIVADGRRLFLQKPVSPAKLRSALVALTLDDEPAPA